MPGKDNNDRATLSPCRGLTIAVGLRHDVRVPGFRLSGGLLGSFLFGE
jgi:hypothetical protein